MKKIFPILAAVLLTVTLWAQTPQKLSYQAVIRNASSALVTNHAVGMKISILQGTTSVYSETQTPTTNANGLVSIEIGGGTGFNAIDWSGGTYFIMTETDPAGGTNYTISGTSQLLSVPYALFSEKAADLNYASVPKAGDILYSNGTSWQLLSKGVNGQTLRLDNGLPKWGEPGYALPMVTTNAASNVMQTEATSGGNIISTGYSDIIACGVCWSTNKNPTTADSKTTETVGIGNFTSLLSGLLPNTTYFVRAYTTNSAGTAYGNQVSLETFLTVVFPTVTTSAAINVSENAAASGGNVTETGGAEVTAKGICWGTNQNPTVADNKTIDGNGTGQFSSQMTNLIPGTTYYIRAYAGNNTGIGYGDQVPLTTLKTIPTIITKNVTSISAVGGVSGGTITISGGGAISDKGICWSESENPTINDNIISAGSGIAAFNSAINMLKPNTTCYVRAYAVNEIGIAYGSQKSFISLDAYYEGFETGFPGGSTGTWGLLTTNSFEGAYSLGTNQTGSSASLTRTLESSGQILFWSMNSNFGSRISFYIDDVLQGTSTSLTWLQKSFPVSSGLHTFKWVYGTDSVGYTGWVDYIIMPK